MEDRELLKKRFFELANRSYNSATFTFTDFLGLSEFAVFEEIKSQISGVKYTAFGGTEGTERVILRFGDPEELGYCEDFPIVIIKSEPLSPKFAEKLTHRDYLGALLNLGIERSTLGDIAIIDNTAYIFASDQIAPFIISELKRVRHTDVKLSEADALPEGELYKTERRRAQVTSERIDAVIAKIFSLSRDEAQSLFKKRLVFVSGKLCESTSYKPKPNDVISVRGYGRMIYRSYSSLSKKGKFNIELDVYV